MALTWSSITSWDPGPLDNAATDLYQASRGLREAYDAGEGSVNAVRSEGVAVLAMRAATSKNLSALEQALTNVNGALMAIEGARDGVATIKARVTDALAYASSNNCTIASDGSVNCTPADPDPQTVIAALHREQTLTEKVKTILEDAERVDSELSSALSAINSDTYTDGDGADNKVIGVPDFPKSSWTPSQNAAWWKSLPEERRRFLIDHCPDDIRHLDGLPATIRNEANRNALYGYVDAHGTKRQGALADAKEAFEKAEHKLDLLTRQVTPADRLLAGPIFAPTALTAARKEYARTAEIYESLKTIHDQIDSSKRSDAYLLDFNYDTKHHRTTAIVASGNPDTASYVSTLVPGIGTNVHDSLGQYIDINDRLRAQTRHAGVDPNDVATISYLGYVAPKNSLHDLGIFQAADIDYAKEGAPKIARFMEGLRAHGNANNHRFINTLATHSYGSTTGGIAATQTAPGTIDRLILTGSPGSGVQSIDQYNVPKGHVYESSVPENDMVQDLGFDSTYGRDPKKLEGITHLSGDATDSERYKPIPPANERWAYPTGQQTPHPLSNHSTYFDWGTRTSQDFANIIAGDNPTTDEEWAAIKAARAKENNGH
nr:alpha/beta hydrolase [Schaalia odontolytica]